MESSVVSSGKGFFIAFVLMSVTALSACQRSAALAESKPALPAVRTVEARSAAATYELWLPARAQAGQIARLHSRVSGFVEARLVDIGDKVDAGQVLARIAAPEVQQAMREAVAQLASSRAAEELARANAERASSLIGSGAISTELHTERLAAFEVTRASRLAAEARLASSRERQAFTEIRAPFSGVISARSIEQGDRVVGDQSAASALFELIALDPLRVVVDVPQGAAMQVLEGTPASVRFVELPNETLSAVVVRRAQSISSDGGGMRVELSLPNSEGRIPAGMVGEIGLSLPRVAQAVLVPISAVVNDARGARVARVSDDATLDVRRVVVGRNLGSDIEILDGISAGDQVVTSPNALVESGSKVSVTKAASKP